MANELINLDLANLTSECADKAKKLSSLAVSPSNCIALESARTEANKEIKAYKSKIEEAKAIYLKPFEEVEAKYLEAIKPYEEEAKRFSGAILEAKKIRKQGELEEYYKALTLDFAEANEGQLPKDYPTFEKCLEGISASAPQSTARELIKARIQASVHETANVMITGSKHNLAKLKSYAIALQCEWEEF